jgi:hypothetical protein
VCGGRRAQVAPAKARGKVEDASCSSGSDGNRRLLAQRRQDGNNARQRTTRACRASAAAQTNRGGPRPGGGAAETPKACGESRLPAVTSEGARGSRGACACGGGAQHGRQRAQSSPCVVGEPPASPPRSTTMLVPPEAEQTISKRCAWAQGAIDASPTNSANHTSTMRASVCRWAGRNMRPLCARRPGRGPTTLRGTSRSTQRPRLRRRSRRTGLPQRWSAPRA